MEKTTIADFPALRVRGSSARPTLFFVHGAFDTHESFGPWMEALASDGWSSVSVSRRGRLGIGPVRAEGLCVGDYFDDTLKVLDALPEKPIIVGHSLGGLIAQKMAELSRAQALVLIASAPSGKLPAQPVALSTYLPMMPKILTGKPILPSAAGCHRIALNCVPEAQRQAIYETMVHESGTVFRELIFGAIKVNASKVTCPVFAIGGAKDRIVGESVVRRTATQLNAALRIYDDRGHWLPGEPGWESILADVGTWLNQQFPLKLNQQFAIKNNKEEKLHG